MFINTALLHSGAAESHRASKHAQDGAHHLLGTSPVAGMFGGFTAAEAFHDAVSSAHAYHVKTLQHDQESLSDVGARTHQVAYSFSTMEDNNAKALRDV